VYGGLGVLTHGGGDQPRELEHRSALVGTDEVVLACGN
jgi:hypothetical protein